jgi:hypothetical protein
MWRLLRALVAFAAGCMASKEPTVRELPETNDALVVRTDFTDDAAWHAICAAIREPVGEFQFRAYVDVVSDREYDGLTPDQLRSLIAKRVRSFFFVVDRVTLSHPDRPILVVDLYQQPGRCFRVIPSEMWSVENNLSLANMDFDDFAESVDRDGVFRGFPEP